MLTWLFRDMKPLERAVTLAVAGLVIFGFASLWLGMVQRHTECVEALKEPNMEGAVRMALCKP